MNMSEKNEVIQELRNITECGICLKTYSDPRMLPCIHTFCLGCLQEIVSKLAVGSSQEFPCPICRKEFVVPAKGLEVLQKNFFMEKLVEMTKTVRSAKRKLCCDVCMENNSEEGKEVKPATEFCVDCRDSLCTDCARQHKKHRTSQDHQLVEVGSHTEETATKKILKCSQHQDKPLEVYCFDCKQLVCVLCLVTGHRGHNGEDMNRVMREFSEDIEKDVNELDAFEKLGLALMDHSAEKKEKFLQELNEAEFQALQQGQKLKDIIDRHVKSVHNELYLLRENQLEELESQKEELERKVSTIASFKEYCNETRMKALPEEICNVRDELRCKTKELTKGLYEQKLSSNRICFTAASEGVHMEKLLQSQEEFLSSRNSVLPKDNIIGKITVETDIATQLKQSLVIVGLDDGLNITREVCRISLSRPNEFTQLPQIPSRMAIEASAITYNNALFVVGVGASKNEIWRYNFPAFWTKCGNLNQGRRRHSTAAMDTMLYVCGGFVDSEKTVLDSVESFVAIGDVKLCTAVGKLVFGVQGAACVAYRRCVYLFGGADKDNRCLDYVQSYDTVLNSCTLLSKPLPRAHKLMRAVLWNTSVVLLGNLACFVFDFEKETWYEREQFKMDVGHFGLFLCDDHLFVIGGGKIEFGQDGKAIWSCRDDVRFVPIASIVEDKRIGWRRFGCLPKPTMVHSYGLVTTFDK